MVNNFLRRSVFPHAHGTTTTTGSLFSAAPSLLAFLIAATFHRIEADATVDDHIPIQASSLSFFPCFLGFCAAVRLSRLGNCAENISIDELKIFLSRLLNELAVRPGGHGCTDSGGTRRIMGHDPASCASRSPKHISRADISSSAQLKHQEQEQQRVDETGESKADGGRGHRKETAARGTVTHSLSPVIGVVVHE
ncbi:unnamed protein product [Gongylonema pulchrum]|uniref:Secreted protein n=1 Tax=Gongylonema pulchrum TaxID=637853 RepID=A0A183DP85_9BILA|nr:unnamed protein product [Gongylonema pulchrum]